MRIDIGKLTPDETEEILRECIRALTEEILRECIRALPEEILRECIRALPEETFLNVLKEVLTLDQVDELVESMP